MSNEATFSIALQVRDYECDLQGVVNNANYLHYLEHARHEYLKDRGIGFAELHERGVDPVLVRAEVDYRIPLVSGDAFRVRLSVERQGKFRAVFRQSVERSDGALAIEAKMFVAVLMNGRPTPFERAFTADELSRIIPAPNNR